MSKVNSDVTLIDYSLIKGIGTVIKHDKDALVELETKCFPPDLQTDWEDHVDLLADSVSCFFFGDDKAKLIAEILAIDLEKEDDIGDDDPHHEHWMKVINAYKGQKVAYIYSISVHPDHQGKDLAKRMMISLIADLKKKGYTTILSHAGEGGSLHIHEFFGFVQRGAQRNWYGTGHTHILCELSLDYTYMLPLIEPVQQDLGYDCGIACIENVLGYKGLPYTKEKLFSDSGVNHQGTTHSGLWYALKESSKKEPLELGDIIALKHEIRHGRPVIIHVTSPGVWEGHYVVAMGYDNYSLYVFEVYDGLFGRMSWEEVRRCWWSNIYQDTWGVSIGDNT